MESVACDRNPHFVTRTPEDNLLGSNVMNTERLICWSFRSAGYWGSNHSRSIYGPDYRLVQVQSFSFRKVNLPRPIYGRLKNKKNNCPLWDYELDYWDPLRKGGKPQRTTPEWHITISTKYNLTEAPLFQTWTHVLTHLNSCKQKNHVALKLEAPRFHVRFSTRGH